VNFELIPLAFLPLALAAWLVGLSKGGLPTIGMLAVPLLSLHMPPMQAAILLLPVYLVSDAVGIWLYRRDFSMPHLRVLVPAGLLGIGLGWTLAAYVSDQMLTIMLGIMGIAFCLNTWLRQSSNAERAPLHAGKGWLWGALSGFTSFISHAGGPPYQIFMLPQRLPKLVFAGTSTIYFAILNSAKIIPYQFIQPYNWDLFMQAVVLMPMAIIGAFMGAWIARRLAETWFYRLVQIGLFAISLKLVWSALTDWGVF
jgi:uncharacterized membrane protein YfcA